MHKISFPWIFIKLKITLDSEILSKAIKSGVRIRTKIEEEDVLLSSKFQTM